MEAIHPYATLPGTGNSKILKEHLTDNPGPLTIRRSEARFEHPISDSFTGITMAKGSGP